MKRIILLNVYLLFAIFSITAANKQTQSEPKIVNIINFVRLLEPRNPETFTEDYLYKTVENQVNDLREAQLPSTFLLQYDALITERYQTLLKEKLYKGSEIGGWWEITQPHVEAAGLEWRGRYPWDWHAHVGFSTGYTPKERELLVDVFMEKFKEIFGKYPSTIGSWFIDAHTLSYMYDKYGIVASCNCKDQYGTDGYTMWGGYWNGAYYPSKKNAYMPAQNAANQIPVPIFRMLSSDPIYQYDSDVNKELQRVFTLEPACTVGSDRKWVEWYLDAMFTQPCLTYAYVQVGQENSFGWDRFEEGWNIQIPLIKKYSDEGMIMVQTLEESGRWFKNKYKVTPPTAVTAMTAYDSDDIGTVWYHSRFYRVNMKWEEDMLRFRDIHLFDERIESSYLYQKGTSTKCDYYTMPFVDGYLWSTEDKLAALRFVEILPDGTSRPIKTGKPVVTENVNDLLVECNSQEGPIKIICKEKTLEVKMNSHLRWALELTIAQGKKLPFKQVESKRIKASFDKSDYMINAIYGVFVDGKDMLRIEPEGDNVLLDFDLSEH